MFPKLCCGLATVYLRRCLGGWGVVWQGFYKVTPHTVLVADDFLVDITADQFGGPAIYVGHILYPWTPYPTTQESHGVAETLVPETSGEAGSETIEVGH